MLPGQTSQGSPKAMRRNERWNTLRTLAGDHPRLRCLRQTATAASATEETTCQGETNQPISDVLNSALKIVLTSLVQHLQCTRNATKQTTTNYELYTAVHENPSCYTAMYFKTHLLALGDCSVPFSRLWYVHKTADDTMTFKLPSRA